MGFIRNTNLKNVQIQFLAQNNVQNRAQNVQEEKNGQSTKECQLALP